MDGIFAYCIEIDHFFLRTRHGKFKLLQLELADRDGASIPMVKFTWSTYYFQADNIKLSTMLNIGKKILKVTLHAGSEIWYRILKGIYVRIYAPDDVVIEIGAGGNGRVDFGTAQTMEV
jgi:hypothetical protein